MYHNNENDKLQSAASTESTNPAGGQTSSYKGDSAQAPASSRQEGAPGASGYPYSPAGQPPYPGYQAPVYHQQNSYSWGPQVGQNTQPPQQAPYYVQPPKKKRHPGKTAAKATAAVLACAVVSLSSVGIFAAMIQNGVVNVQSPEGAEKTAAFTLYKRDESTGATPTVSREGMSTQEVAQKLIPSVVCVQNYQVARQQYMDNPFGFFFGEQEGGVQEGDGELSPSGEGSGIIISEDGYIVTNQHVISGASNIKVVTSDGAT